MKRLSKVSKTGCLIFIILGAVNIKTVFCNIQLDKKSRIHILCTTALISAQYQRRQKEYTHSFDILKHMGFEPFIVESCLPSNSRTFLNDHSDYVLYANINNLKLEKGINEFKALEAAFDFFNFEDNDIIIKMTGRYFFENDFLIQQILDHPQADVLVRWGGQPGDFVSQGHVFTGCFAMRASHFKKMLKQIDYSYWAQHVKPVEAVVADYILNNIVQEKIISLPKIYVSARVFFSNGSNNALSHWSKRRVITY